MVNHGHINFFFFSSRRRHTRCSRDWSSDVCSSDLTEGFLRLGSNAPTLGASPLAWAGCSNAAEGVVVGAGTVSGNPWEMRFSVPLGATHPAVAEALPLVSRLFTHSKMNPGTLPFMAVTWNVEMVSNSQPYPTRTEVLPSGAQARPTRGANAPRLEFLNQPLDLTKVTDPCEPSMGLSGASVVWASNGGGLYSQRSPAFTVSFLVMCHSSCT